MTKSNETDAEIGDVIVEFTALGTLVKVCAIHVATGREVSIQGPASAGVHVLKHQAVQKLKYVLGRQET